MTTKTVASDLLAAADYINKNGWCRNEFLNEKGQVCLAGAIGVATGAIKPSKTNKNEWDWATAKAPRIRYSNAVRAVAVLLSQERVDQLLKEFDERTAENMTSTWFTGMTAKQRDEYKTSRAASRAWVSQDVVTVWNDREDVTPAKKPGVAPKVKRTTKAQAVKLLQRAASA